ncbi:MlaE family lipid ABC transporter permease subunit [candidate division KSB3 bacterium]|uniref:MlaE family lipid ABC transporter permease subunit n=1 Tax=candidate division KSB3 bacterium TaxID=2044937 RepID=A0A9D5JYV5_9BACT|nr:MlaE family lipid ABC transporter permease subunit [candidate division KSB3 bacterium]MBD3326904.1 MlaE family lipid ABC transporter permease subunit [candidate division KSB3 bacterium]
MKRLFGLVGYRTLGFFGHVYDATQLTLDSMYWLTIAPLKGKGLRWRSSIDQMVLIGVNSIPIIAVLSLAVGMILALQGAYILRQFGASIYIADLVGVAMTRELSPLVVAVIVAGRSGSSFAAEIGTMKVSEEVDALITIGLNPTKFLVIPKLLAIVIMQPCLTMLSNVISMTGGMVIGIGLLDLGVARYINQTFNALILQDIVTGLIKSVIFAIIIALVGCYEGFQVEGGAEGVGLHTTASVVKSIFLVIFADLVVTTFFFFFL